MGRKLMRMHTDEWLKKDATLSRKYGFTLDQSKYKLDFIKVPFGKEYVPIPSNDRIPSLITCLGTYSVEGGLMRGVMDELVERAGFLEQYRGKTLEVLPEYKERLKEAMGELIFEKGPYYVIYRACERHYFWEVELYWHGGEVPWQWAITDEELAAGGEKTEEELLEELLKEIQKELQKKSQE